MATNRTNRAIDYFVDISVLLYILYIHVYTLVFIAHRAVSGEPSIENWASNVVEK